MKVRSFRITVRRRKAVTADLFEQAALVTGLICGIDEAGCGPLAGPVVAAAVILDPKRRIYGLRDSKVLKPERRAQGKANPGTRDRVGGRRSERR